MQGKFKPKFFKDIGKVKEDREIMTALYKVFVNVEKAEHVDEKLTLNFGDTVTKIFFS